MGVANVFFMSLKRNIGHFVVTFVYISIISAGVRYMISFLPHPEFDLVEVLPPKEVYDRFLYNASAWNLVYENVSYMSKFLNVTIPETLAGKSILEIAEMFGGDVYANDAEYAYCYISVLKRKSNTLAETFKILGFDVREVNLMKKDGKEVQITLFKNYSEKNMKVWKFTFSLLGARNSILQSSSDAYPT